MAERITHKTRAKVAQIVARRFAKKYDWIDSREAEQEVYAALLAVDHLFDPERAEHWLFVTARRHLAGWVFAQRSIIMPSTHVIRQAKLRQPTSDVAERFAALSFGPPKASISDDAIDLFAELAEREWSDRVKARIFELIDRRLAELLFGDRERSDLGSPAKVKRLVRTARAALQRDPMLRELWQAA